MSAHDAQHRGQAETAEHKFQISERAYHLLVDKAFMLNLSAPQMTALVGGLRVLGANVGSEGHGVLTDRPGQLTTDFFTNLLDMGVKWEAVGEGAP